MNLESIDWKDEFSIGNADIDEDHKEIVEIFNEMIVLSVHGKNRDECARLLTKMTNYALSHFKKEENYMQRFSYPKIENHRRQHMEYIYKVSMFNLVFFGSEEFEPYEILKFLRDWWTNHIQKTDRDYENYKRSIQSEVRYDKSPFM